MLTLVLALYPEGHSDTRFLPVLIQRTAEMIIAERGRTEVDVLEPYVVTVGSEAQKQKRAECILTAARQTEGYHALIVHADADYPTPERAMQERIQPGLDLVRAVMGEQHYLVPIVPVRMTEAWLLADPEALLEVIGTRSSVADLDLPEQARLVESDPAPKQTLERVVKDATKQRRRRSTINVIDLYEPLARRINLERLQQVPAYQQFILDLSTTLALLSIITPIDGWMDDT